VADDGGLPVGRKALRGDSLTGICRASRDLGIAERWLRQAVRSGELPVYRLNVQVRLRVSDIRRWLESRRMRP